MTDTHGYRPGHCNIGRQERRQRSIVAAAAFAASALYALASAASYVPTSLLPAVFIPLSIGFEWGLQAWTSFCVRLALLSRYDVGGDGGSVRDPDHRHADRTQAAKITASAVVLAAVTTALLTVLIG